MTIFEMLGLCGALVVAVLCCDWGWSLFGWPGAIVGVTVGVVVGFVLVGWGSIFVGYLLLRFFIWCERRHMRSHFGEYWAARFTGDWEAVSTRLNAGDAVHGRVVRRFDRESYLDIGEKFPARLALTATPDGEGLPDVGTEVEATVLGLEGLERVIELATNSETVRRRLEASEP